MSHHQSIRNIQKVMGIEDEIGTHEMTRAVCLTASENIKNSVAAAASGSSTVIDDAGTKSTLKSLITIAKDEKKFMKYKKRSSKINRNLKLGNFRIVQGCHMRQKLEKTVNNGDEFKQFCNFTADDAANLGEKFDEYREYVSDAKHFIREAAKMVIPACEESDSSDDSSDEDANRPVPRYPNL